MNNNMDLAEPEFAQKKGHVLFINLNSKKTKKYSQYSQYSYTQLTFPHSLEGTHYPKQPLTNATQHQEQDKGKTYNNIEDLFITGLEKFRPCLSNEQSCEPIHSSGCISNQRDDQDQERGIQRIQSFQIKARGKKIKKFNKCGHNDKEHYAKEMCRACYTKYGRTKKPWNCEHETLYAQGFCQVCYANKYNQMKKVEKRASSSSNTSL